MLTPDEELKLEWLIEEIGTESLISISDIKWVVSKLIQLNDEQKNGSILDEDNN